MGGGPVVKGDKEEGDREGREQGASPPRRHLDDTESTQNCLMVINGTTGIV